ncbi:MAG: tetratricopeptide repeat protein [Steroidobacterales bacterium]
MRNVYAAFLALTATVAFAAPVLADNDPSMQQIYNEANSGHLDHAQQMINQVLHDHPRSAKAHYVAAELAAKEGKLGDARGELGQAEQLAPGLPFADAQSVRSLKAELGQRSGGGALMLAPQQHSFPWLPVILLVGLVMLVWTIVRRRSTAVVQYPGGAYSGAPAGAGPYPAPGLGAPVGGGIGSGIAGGLASGLAVGAGVVAGEELARHFLDGDHHQGGTAPANTDEPPSNSDMGGNDFGVNDTGGWDDSGGGGGGDWS